jgi:uncharacterized protein (TIGR02118 family)
MPARPPGSVPLASGQFVEPLRHLVERPPPGQPVRLARAHRVAARYLDGDLVAAFEEFYPQVHGPMAARDPGVQKLELSRTSDGFAGEPSPFYRVAEMYFHDREAMDIATTTPE